MHYSTCMCIATELLHACVHFYIDVTLTMDHLSAVINVLMEAREEWYFIGQRLGCKIADLKGIDNKYLPNKKMCVQKMMELRIQRGGLTRSMLCDSLRGENVWRDDVARNIEALDLTLPNK